MGQIIRICNLRLVALALATVLCSAQALGARRDHDAEQDRAHAAMSAYVRARLAEAQGQADRSAQGYRDSFDHRSGNDALARRAYRQALIAGDRALAVDAAMALRASGTLAREGYLLLLVDALSRRDAVAARSVADAMAEQDQLGFLAPFARSWASVIAGPYDPPVIATGDPFASYALRHLDEQIMLQALVRGDGAGAAVAFDAVRDKGVTYPPQLRAILAARFVELGQRASALVLLQREEPDRLADARARVEAGRKLPKMRGRVTPQVAMAVLIDRLAGDLAAGSGNGTGAVLGLLRMAHFADPENLSIRVALARALLGAGHGPVAFAEAGLVPADAPQWADAQAVRVAALIRMGRMDDAVVYARNLARNPASGAREARMLGEVLLQAGQAEEAAAALSAAGDPARDARLALQLGGALADAGRWEQARPHFERAVMLDPDNAAILNHFGYSLAERGEELPRAIAMLEKANAIAPNEAAYIDSLGWAYFRAGQVERALPLLEKAVADAPGQSEISEHLGDALWAAGRRFEARHAWTAARVTADDADKARLTVKIERGPTPAP